MSFLTFMTATLAMVIVTVSVNFKSYEEVESGERMIHFLFFFPEEIYNKQLYLVGAAILLCISCFFLLPVL